MKARAVPGLVLVLMLALCAAARAETCSELSARVEELRGEIGRMERDALAGDARLLECQGALAAIFAERREMKGTVERTRWEACAHRLAIELQMVLGTLEDRALTRPQGDPMRPVDDAMDAVLRGGVFTLTGGGAAQLDLRGATSTSTRAPQVHMAALSALREQLALIDEAVDTGPAPAALPEPTSADKQVRRYEEPDALLEDAAVAPALRARAAALDAALGTLELSLEHERRPSELLREQLEKKQAELARVQARLAACTGN